MTHRRLAEALRLSRDLLACQPCKPHPGAEAAAAAAAAAGERRGRGRRGGGGGPFLAELPPGAPALSSASGRCSRRHALSGPRRAPLSHDASSIFSLAFAPGGACLAAGFGNGAVQLVDAATGAPGASFFFAGPRTRQAATAVSFHRARPGLLLAASADGTVTVFDLLGRRSVSSLTEKENEINALDFCRDGSVFATAGKDRHIRLYDSFTNQLFQVIEAPDFMAGDEFSPHSGHSRRIFALRFHPTELHLFLTGGWDNSIKHRNEGLLCVSFLPIELRLQMELLPFRKELKTWLANQVWDKRVLKGAQSVISGPHICGPGIDIKGNHVLTGSWVPRNALQLWDLRTSRLWQNLPFPGSPTQGEFLYSAQFCTDDLVLAGGSGTCGASVVHVGTDQVVGEILLKANKPVHVVASAPGGFCVAVAGAGGNLHLAELH